MACDFNTLKPFILHLLQSFNTSLCISVSNGFYAPIFYAPTVTLKDMGDSHKLFSCISYNFEILFSFLGRSRSWFQHSRWYRQPPYRRRSKYIHHQTHSWGRRSGRRQTTVSDIFVHSQTVYNRQYKYENFSTGDID